MKTAEFRLIESEPTPRGLAPIGSGGTRLLPLAHSLKNILVPLDLSKESLRALQYAIPLARQFGAALNLLHVLPTPPYMTDTPYAALGDGNAIETVDWRLKQIAEANVGGDISRQTITRTGYIIDTIVSLAKEKMIDLIILTKGGHTGLKHILLDSIAEGVVRDAPCHVLVIRQQGREVA